MCKNILVIESNRSCRVLMQEILETFGINGYIVENGTKGLVYYENNDIDLVLLNNQLPDISDTEIIKSLKRIKPIPIIVQSARCFPFDISRALNAGCDYFMEKPIQIELLHEKIQEYLK